MSKYVCYEWLYLADSLTDPGQRDALRELGIRFLTTPEIATCDLRTLAGEIAPELLGMRDGYAVSHFMASLSCVRGDKKRLERLLLDLDVSAPNDLFTQIELAERGRRKVIPPTIKIMGYPAGVSVFTAKPPSRPTPYVHYKVWIEHCEERISRNWEGSNLLTMIGRAVAYLLNDPAWQQTPWAMTLLELYPNYSDDAETFGRQVYTNPASLQGGILVFHLINQQDGTFLWQYLQDYHFMPATTT